MLETTVVAALVASGAVVAASFSMGHATRTHAAALALEAALADARALAKASADASDPATATGATVAIAHDPAFPADPARTRIVVYRSRPLAYGRPTPERGFTPVSVAGRIGFEAAGAARVEEPFAIAISSAGDASVLPLPDGDDAVVRVRFANDPGCAANGASLIVEAEGAIERHDFGCAGATYAAN